MKTLHHLHSKTFYFPLLFCGAFLFSCQKVTDTAKETVNKGGETVGQTASEFVNGVAKGIDKTYLPELVISEDLKTKGLKSGKYMIGRDTSGSDNMLSVYLIFDKDLKTELKAKAFDANGLEIGRAKTTVDKKAGEATYYDFHFDKRTVMEAKSKLVIE